MKNLLLRKCISLALAGVTTLACVSAQAVTSVNDKIIETVKQSNANYLKKDGKFLYFINLNDKPLATYDGSLMGIAATSIQSTQGVNATKKRQLDINSIASKSYRSILKARQDTLHVNIQKQLKRELKFLNQYQIILNATTAFLTPEEAIKLESLTAIASVVPVERHELHTDVGPSFIKAPYVWNKDWGQHNEADAVGFKGEGLTVGIMDTGIDFTSKSFAATGDDDYTHTNPLPDGKYLGDCADGKDPAMCNDKLIGIVSYDYITMAYALVDQVDVPPYGIDYNGHGTHTASTTAGNVVKNVAIYNIYDQITDGSFAQISGVAPHANIISYQTCAPTDPLFPPGMSGCFPHLAAAAMEHAIEHGVSVMNYSIGGPARDPWDKRNTDSQMFLNARAAGLHIATSAGNNGPGEVTIGSPANTPWITTVAAFTHDRKVDKEINNFSGGDESLLPTSITGVAMSGGITATVVDAADFGDGLCNEEFEAGTFNGEIVTCLRGDIARVDKGYNVLTGGAGGLILVNASAEETIVADAHDLPAIHITYASGQELYNWLAEGEGHQATITPFVSGETKAELGNIAAYFTSRGPHKRIKSFLTPDVAGPGVDIFAAVTTKRPFLEIPDEENPREFAPYAFMSGTSMSSPHVAGALALIHGVQPSWDPSETQSAMMLTATIDGLRTHDDQESTPFIHGSGSIRLDKAVETGLVMAISKEEYIAADPFNRYDSEGTQISEAGDPHTLNLPSFTKEGCLISCSWVRTFKAVKDASWTASYDNRTAGFSLSVSPANFTLKAGETQKVTITATAGAELTEKWAYGYVRFNSDNATIPEVHLSGIVNFIGGVIEDVTMPIAINGNSGTVTFKDINSIGSNDLQVTAFGPSPVDVYPGELFRDFEFNPEEGVPSWWHENEALHIETISTGLKTRQLIVRITDSEAPDLDLYVGVDSNKDGKPNPNEFILCLSGKQSWDEECIIQSDIPTVYWIAVHQFTSSAPGAVDKHTLEITKLEERGDIVSLAMPETVASNEVFDVSVNFNDPEMQADKHYVVGIELGTSAETPTNIGFALSEIIRGDDEVTASQPVVTNGSLSMQINALGNSSEQYKLYQFELTLQENSVISGLTLADEDVSFEVNGNTISWTYLMAPGSAAVDFDVVVDTSAVTVDITVPVLNSSSFLTTIAAPTLSIANASLSVNAGQAVSLDFEVTTGSTLEQVQATLTAEVISGAANLSITGNNVSFTAPSASTASQVVLEITANNGAFASTSQMVTVDVAAKVVVASPAKGSSSGGSFGFGLLGVFALASLVRRQRSW